MAGYYDEESGAWVDTGDSAGFDQLTDTSGTGTINYGGTVNSDGSVTYTDPDGSVYTVNPNGTYTTQYMGSDVTYDPSQGGFVDSAGKLIQGGVNASVTGKSLLDTLKSAIAKNPIASAITGAAGLQQLYKNLTQTGGGYNKPVPKMEAVRQQIAYDDTNRAPGSMGRQYFTDTQFVPSGNAAAKEAALTSAATQAAGLKALQPAAAPQVNPWQGKMATPWEKQPASATLTNSAPATALAVPKPNELTETGGIKMAHGGIASMARGGRYLPGSTDGMADKINTSIDDQQPAKLSHGEFVIPADVVSHMGNGNSEAGAKKLYEMMARIRKARTGNPEQGKKINPDKYMPGGIVGLATGGAVPGYADGGSAGVTSTGASGIPLDTSNTSTLSPWVGDYATTALGQGAALAAAPYKAYTGQLTAGPSNLQEQAFAGASDIAKTGFTPGQFSTGTFGTAEANKYMNPYLSAALTPQMEELKRQADIKRLADAGRLTQAGAYGGSRQAIMESEGNRNLLDLQRRALGEGYATAFDKAMQQFNTEQGRQFDVQKANEAARQYSGEYGLKSLDALAGLGKTQRDITQQGLEADKQQFEEQRDWAYKMPQYQLNLLGNLPISAQTKATDTSGLSGILSNTAGLASLYQTLKNLGIG